jgi:SAM-dependent methyltransferase
VSESHERYAPGWGADAVAMMSSRTAHRRAGFLLPFLKNGMRVLDVGCGPGTITLGLAEAVAPDGDVVGVDTDASQLELARATSVGNVSFQVGSAYALPFADQSFDAVLAHALLEHLAQPKEALAEIRRVLRPGGLVGVCSSDWSGAVVEPRSADVELALSCHFELRRHAGGDPFAGARLPSLIEEAGFVGITTTVTDELDLSYRELAAYVGERIERVDGAAAARRWARGEDGTFTQRWVAVSARKP